MFARLVGERKKVASILKKANRMKTSNPGH